MAIFVEIMSQQLELLTESPPQWGPVSFLTPEIQKKEIKPFVLCKLIYLKYYIEDPSC